MSVVRYSHIYSYIFLNSKFWKVLVLLLLGVRPREFTPPPKENYAIFYYWHKCYLSF